MNISTTLHDVIHGRESVLTADLVAAGHIAPEHGLSLDATTLMTADGNGNRVDLTAAAQAFVTAWVPPPRPTSPSYGTDLLSDDDLMAQAAGLVTQLRQYIGLAAPTTAQQKSWENGISKIMIYLIHQRFPGL